MTQFKEKSDGAGVRLGRPLHVSGAAGRRHPPLPDRHRPGRDDQRQHIELTRDVAERFNSRYGETFTLPRGVYPEVGAKIMDLQEPEKKMSTTGGTEQGTVYILDSPDEIRQEVQDRRHRLRAARSATRRDKPGISNLIEIMTVVDRRVDRGRSRRATTAQGYGTFKSDVAEAVVALLEPIQERFRELRERRRASSSGCSRSAPRRRARRRGRRSTRCTSAWASSRLG